MLINSLTDLELELFLSDLIEMKIEDRNELISAIKQEISNRKLEQYLQARVRINFQGY